MHEITSCCLTVPCVFSCYLQWPTTTSLTSPTGPAPKHTSTPIIKLVRQCILNRVTNKMLHDVIIQIQVETSGPDIVFLVGHEETFEPEQPTRAASGPTCPRFDQSQSCSHKAPFRDPPILVPDLFGKTTACTSLLHSI